MFNYYAATVFFGPDRMTEFYTFNDGDPWGFMAEEVLPGIGGLLVIFAILNSSLANANSGATAATRTLFAMGRVRLLPGWFAAIHPTNRTPVNAVHFQAITRDHHRGRPRGDPRQRSVPDARGRIRASAASTCTSSSARCWG